MNDLESIFGRGNNPIRVGVALAEPEERQFGATLTDAYQAGYRTQCPCGEVLDEHGICGRCGKKFE